MTIRSDADDLAEYLNENLSIDEDTMDKISTATMLDALASLGLTLIEDDSAAARAYYEMLGGHAS